MLGVLVYRKIGLGTMDAVFLDSARQSASTILLISGAFKMNCAVANERLGETLVPLIEIIREICPSCWRLAAYRPR